MYEFENLQSVKRNKNKNILANVLRLCVCVSYLHLLSTTVSYTALIAFTYERIRIVLLDSRQCERINLSAEYQSHWGLRLHSRTHAKSFLLSNDSIQSNLRKQPTQSVRATRLYPRFCKCVVSHWYWKLIAQLILIRSDRMLSSSELINGIPKCVCNMIAILISEPISRSSSSVVNFFLEWNESYHITKYSSAEAA